MACENHHTDCIGPICTQSNGPKRMLVGAAKDKASIMEALTAANSGRGEIKPTSFTCLFYRLDGALAFTSKAQDIINRQNSWKWTVNLSSSTYGYDVRIRLSKIKV